MTTEESQNNDSGGRYMVLWWCQWRHGKKAVEVNYNYYGLLQQHRSHRMNIAGVYAKRNANDNSFVGQKIFRIARAAVAEAKGN